MARNRFGFSTTAAPPIDADGVVLATDVSGLAKIVGASPQLGDEDWRSHVADLRYRSAVPGPAALARPPRESDRPAFLGTGGLKPLDNISVLERYEEQAAEWARAHGGSVVELHAYAVGDGTSHEEIRAQLLDRLHDLYPETASANVVGERILYREDCPRFAPGDHDRRPGVSTPHAALALAGDGIRIDLPVALMERAATTGFAAANQLLSHWGIRGHTLHTVPIRGTLPGASAARRWKGVRAHEHVHRAARAMEEEHPAAVPSTDGMESATSDVPRRQARHHRECLGAVAASGERKLVRVRREYGRPRERARSAPRSAGSRSSRGATATAAYTSGREPAHTSVPRCAPAPWTTVRSSARGTAFASMAAANSAGSRCPAMMTAFWRGCGWTPWVARSRSKLPWSRSDRPVRQISAVTRVEGICEPDDVIANRLDPWHGAWFHPYSFTRLDVLTAPPDSGEPPEDEDRFLVAVTFRMGRVGVPVIAEFVSPGPRTIVMRIIEGEGAGSVVETHATPMGPGQDGRPRTAVLEAVVAHSDRPGFVHGLRAARLIAPAMRHAAKRLWRDDLAYAERRYHLRAAAGGAEPIPRPSGPPNGDT